MNSKFITQVALVVTIWDDLSLDVNSMMSNCRERGMRDAWMGTHHIRTLAYMTGDRPAR